MNAWWFCSPTQLLILQKGKKKLLGLGGERKKRKELASFFPLPPPTVREPHLQGLATTQAASKQLYSFL